MSDESGGGVLEREEGNSPSKMMAAVAQRLALALSMLGPAAPGLADAPRSQPEAVERVDRFARQRAAALVEAAAKWDWQALRSSFSDTQSWTALRRDPVFSGQLENILLEQTRWCKADSEQYLRALDVIRQIGRCSSGQSLSRQIMVDLYIIPLENSKLTTIIYPAIRRTVLATGINSIDAEVLRRHESMAMRMLLVELEHGPRGAAEYYERCLKKLLEEWEPSNHYTPAVKMTELLGCMGEKESGHTLLQLALENNIDPLRTTALKMLMTPRYVPFLRSIEGTIQSGFRTALKDAKASACAQLLLHLHSEQLESHIQEWIGFLAKPDLRDRAIAQINKLPEQERFSGLLYGAQEHASPAVRYEASKLLAQHVPDASAKLAMLVLTAELAFLRNQRYLRDPRPFAHEEPPRHAGLPGRPAAHGAGRSNEAQRLLEKRQYQGILIVGRAARIHGAGADLREETSLFLRSLVERADMSLTIRIPAIQALPPIDRNRAELLALLSKRIEETLSGAEMSALLEAIGAFDLPALKDIVRASQSPLVCYWSPQAIERSTKDTAELRRMAEDADYEHLHIRICEYLDMADSPPRQAK